MKCAVKIFHRCRRAIGECRVISGGLDEGVKEFLEMGQGVSIDMIAHFL